MKQTYAILINTLLFSCLFVFSQASAAAEKNPDPWENWNRKVYNFNTVIDSNFLRPIAKGYKDYTPDLMQRGVSNVFSNFGEISNVTNNALQGNKNGFVASTWRFIINSTVGVFGIFDVASSLGLREYDEDFGQTLGYWGVPSGPYLVLPFFGPSTVRSAGGLVVDMSSYKAQDNIGLNHDQRWGMRAVHVVSKRASLLSAENLIVGDPYSFVRDVYLQSRGNDIYGKHSPRNPASTQAGSTDSWGDDGANSWGDDETDSWGDSVDDQAAAPATDSWGDPVPAQAPGEADKPTAKEKAVKAADQTEKETDALEKSGTSDSVK